MILAVCKCTKNRFFLRFAFKLSNHRIKPYVHNLVSVSLFFSLSLSLILDFVVPSFSIRNLIVKSYGTQPYAAYASLHKKNHFLCCICGRHNFRNCSKEKQKKRHRIITAHNKSDCIICACVINKRFRVKFAIHCGPSFFFVVRFVSGIVVHVELSAAANAALHCTLCSFYGSLHVLSLRCAPADFLGLCSTVCCMRSVIALYIIFRCIK